MKKLIKITLISSLVLLATGCKEANDEIKAFISGTTTIDTIDTSNPSPACTNFIGTFEGTNVISTVIENDLLGNKTTITTYCDGTVNYLLVDRNGETFSTSVPIDFTNSLGSVDGVWRGTFSPDDKTQATTYFKAFITQNRNVVMLSDSESSFEIQGSDMLQSTSLVQTSEGVTINLLNYKKENTTAPSDVVIEAKLTPRDNIVGTYVRGEESGNVVFIYDAAYETQESTADVIGAGTPFFHTSNTYWTLSKTIADDLIPSQSTYEFAFKINNSFKVEGVGSEGMTFTFNDDGNIIATSFPPIAPDTAGCNYEGNIDIVDPYYFIYNISLKVRDCSLAGDYKGLATLEEEFLPLDVTVVAGIATEKEHPHTHYRFMTFGVSNGVNTINNRLTLEYYGI